MAEERVKELMAQAGTDSSGKWMGVEHAEKLVELTVRECMDVIKNAPTLHCAYTTYDKSVVDCVQGKVFDALHSHFNLKQLF